MVSLPHELLAQLPPSERDFEVFRETVIGRRSTREVAGEFGISQTRICQVLARVWRWHAEVVPQIDSEMPTESQIRAAQYLATDRLDHLYGLALHGFEQSKADQVKHRVNPSGEESTTTASSSGDIRYLLAAMRITIAQGKTGIATGLATSSLALAADDAERRLFALESADVNRPAPTTPAKEASPAGDCSHNVPRREAEAEQIAASLGATADDEPTSKRLSRRQRQARESFLAPVHQPAALAISSSAGGSAVAQLKLSPNVPGAELEFRGNGPPRELERQSA